ncbi:MAG: HEAT repeat domain-containing protein [Planctomycetota bacterium]|jgi:hypothetical protein
MRLLTTLLFLLAFAAPDAAAQRDSVEDLLRRSRQARDAERRELEPEIVELLDELLVARSAAKDREVERLREKIIDYGTIAGLVLVELIGVDEASSEAANRRADEAAELLTRLTAPPVLEPLLEQTEDGPTRGRLRAIRVLGHWPDRDLVVPRLAQLSAEGRRPERLIAVTGLARLGGPVAAERLEAILDDTANPELLEQALVEIGAFQRPELLPLVGALLRNGDNVVAHIDGLLDFFTSAPSQMTEERALLLIELVRRRRLQEDDGITTLEALGGFDLDLRGPVGAALDELERFGRGEIAEAATVCMALLGDSSALRRLEVTYTSRIEEALDQNDHRRYEARANMYVRVHEFKKARRDYEKAISLDSGRGGPADQDLFIGLARTLVLLEDLRKAGSTLEEARLGPARLRTLAIDPDFAPLKDSRYGELLRDV